MSAKRAGEFFSFRRNQLRMLMGLVNLNRPFFRLWLIICVVYANLLTYSMEQSPSWEA